MLLIKNMLTRSLDNSVCCLKSCAGPLIYSTFPLTISSMVWLRGALHPLEKCIIRASNVSFGFKAQTSASGLCSTITKDILAFAFSALSTDLKFGLGLGLPVWHRGTFGRGFSEKKCCVSRTSPRWKINVILLVLYHSGQRKQRVPDKCHWRLGHYCYLFSNEYPLTKLLMNWRWSTNMVAFYVHDKVYNGLMILMKNQKSESARGWICSYNMKSLSLI